MDDLGAKIRAARLKKSLTLKALAGLTNLSISFLSEIERGLSQPSMASLRCISQALGISLISFMENDARAPADGEAVPMDPHVRPAANITTATVVRSDKRKKIAYPGRSGFYELLTPDLNRRLEVLYLKMAPHFDSGPPIKDPPGEKCLVILSGCMQFTVDNDTYMTPFGSGDIFTVVDTITELQKTIPAVAEEWSQYNQVSLGGVGLDTYGILTNFPVNTVDDIDGHKIAAPGPSANWIKGTGAVAVAANLNTYYNGIKTGVFEGTLTFMTAGAAIKVHEVAPHICMVNFGAQFAGALSINKDVFDDFPEYMQKIFMAVGAEYADRLAKAQADKAAGAMTAMEAAGAKVIYLSDEERRKWAEKLPNIPMEWATAMEEKGLPGKQVLKGYLDGLRKRGTVLVRDWDK